MKEKFEHKKSLGQHFLTSDFVPKKMCDAAHIEEGEIILEIGPGTGVLTREILNRGAKVVAVEADKRAILLLNETFPEEIAKKQLTVFHHDARKLDFEMLGLKHLQYKIVSNIPYYISGSLFRQTLDTEIQPNTLVFLVQKEVASRIAREKKESLLSLSVKVYGNPTYICTVKRGNFTPPPKVDSAVVAITSINRENFLEISSVDYFHILHLGFGQKRKQLLGNLSKEFDREMISALFISLQIPLDIRAEDLSLEKWLKIVLHLQSTV